MQIPLPCPQWTVEKMKEEGGSSEVGLLALKLSPICVILDQGWNDLCLRLGEGEGSLNKAGVVLGLYLDRHQVPQEGPKP